MSYYERFSPDVIRKLKELNDEMEKEKRQVSPDGDKIMKLQQQILMKGLEMSVVTPMNYNPKLY